MTNKINNLSIQNNRISGLDIVRVIACISVIASHFFLNTNFYTAPFYSFSMFWQGVGSSLALGSDIYMILTGFLCCNKGINKKFYLSGIKVLLSYLFFSIFTIIIDIYVLHNGMSWKSGILGIFSYSTIPYAWYIEMWIGLFILAPFLNIWYKALPSKDLKLKLIIILLLLSALPDFCNRYGLYLAPAFWEKIYPLSFYFVGCYIREYKPSISSKYLGLLILSIALINPICTVCVGYQKYLPTIGDRNGIFIASMAIAIFIMCYQTDIKSKILRKIFTAISLRSLDIFLCSAVFDSILYPFFMEKYYVNQSQFGIFYFIIVPIIFVLCYTVASGKRIIFNLFQMLLNKLHIYIPVQNTSN